MRVALSFLLVTVLSVACGISTQNSDSLSVKTIELVELNVRQNGEALYELGYFGDEEVATIKKQANSAQLSELEYGYNGAVVINLRYRPQTGFIGKDQLVVETRRGSDGESTGNMIELIIFDISVE